MTLSPDDLPPGDESVQQLYCTCTNDTFKVLIQGGNATMKCTSCGAAGAVFSAGTTEDVGLGDIGGGRDMLSSGATGGPGGSGAMVDGQLRGGGGKGGAPARQQHGAVLRGGELDGQTVPVIDTVTEFIYGMPGAGAAGLSTGAGWATGGDAAQTLGTVYRDTGERDSRGIRIFALAT